MSKQHQILLTLFYALLLCLIAFFFLETLPETATVLFH